MPNRTVASLASLASLVAAIGCGGATATPTATIPAQPATETRQTTKEVPPAGDEQPTAGGPRTALMVAVGIDWVTERVPVTATEARAWAGAPENVARVQPAIRHVLVKSDRTNVAKHAAARKKAEGLLARLVGGADWNVVARESSDDPGSAAAGGAYPGEMVPNFVEPFREAYAALAPGETRKTLVETQFGWHVVKKDAIDDASRISAFRAAHGPSLAKKLASEIGRRLTVANGGDLARASRELDATLVAELGSASVDGTDRARPAVTRVTAFRPVDAPDPVCAAVLEAKPGAATVHELTSSRTFLVVAADAKPVWGPAALEDVCLGVDGRTRPSPEQLRQILDRLQRERGDAKTPAP